MKTLKLFLAFTTLFFFTTQISAFGKYKWQEKETFHKVMSETYHPAEEGNYNPIRNRIDEFQEKAIAFKNSKIPDFFENKKNIKKSLKNLVKLTKSFHKKIKSGASDTELKNDFLALHDAFHQIVGLCNAEDKHDH